MKVAIITNASIPWMTGTSINPLLRASFLATQGYEVDLYLPDLTIGKGIKDNVLNSGKQEWMHYCTSTDIQASMSRDYLGEVPSNLSFKFYDANLDCNETGYFTDCRSNLIEDLIDQYEKIVLEDAVSVLGRFYGFTGNSFSVMDFFRKCFNYRKYKSKIIYIHHTNYMYMLRKKKQLKFFTSLCFWASLIFSKQYALSNVVHPMFRLFKSRDVINLNGVHPNFFENEPKKGLENSVYFIGKLIPEKNISVFIKAIDQISSTKKINLKIIGEPLAHFENDYSYIKNNKNIHYSSLKTTPRPSRELQSYDVFLNPSVSEVLCTTTSEAIAMNKWVIIPKHPSNEFFEDFPNVLLYRNEDEIPKKLEYAFANPVPVINIDSLRWDDRTKILETLLLS